MVGFKFWLVVLSFGWFWKKVVFGAVGEKLRIKELAGADLYAPRKGGSGVSPL
jgi:hypothetical protein